MKVYYDKDAGPEPDPQGRTSPSIGYGSQGHAHAQNLNDSGVKVTVGLRRGGASWPRSKRPGSRWPKSQTRSRVPTS